MKNCHDQGECLRPTPETDAQAGFHDLDTAVPADFARRLERQRNEAREQLASEKATRNAIIAKGIEMEHQLAEARAICEELVTDSNAVTLAATVVRLERERNEAREAFAIATSQLVQVQGELRQAREENARLRAELQNIANAKPSEWGDMSDQFQPWAQNRARHALLTL